MRRLRANDALHLYNEVPTQYLHTLKVAIIDPSEDPEGYSFEREKEKLAARLHLVPPFRWRVVPTPLSLHHPLWIESEVDLDYHVRRAVVPAPGGRKELGQAISEIASQPLDLHPPLWELWMIEGLEGGLVAAVTKLHHSVADGVASAELLSQYLTTRPGEDVPTEETPWEPEGPPTTRRLLWMAFVDLLGFLRRAVPRLFRAIRASRRKRAVRGMAQADRPPKAFTAPPTSFNGILTAQRRFAFITLSLDDAKAVRAAFGGTINDVALATVSGALRRYLQQRRELPDAPLVAAVPVSTRPPEKRGTYGNFVSVMYLALRADVEDPIERLRACQRAAQAAKLDFEDTVGARLPDWIELFPPFVIKRLFSRTTTLMKKMGRPSQANLIISNVRGPSEPLFYNHARLRSFYSVGPLLEGVGLNVTAWSYMDQLDFGLIACREAVPDLWELTDGLRDSLAELTKLAAQETSSNP